MINNLSGYYGGYTPMVLTGEWKGKRGRFTMRKIINKPLVRIIKRNFFTVVVRVN